MKKGAGYHHGNLRLALVEATTQLVDSRGTDGFTLRAAAKLAGVSDGAPYHHFVDKEALLAAVAEAGFALLHDEMHRALYVAEKSSGKKGCALGVAYVLFAVRHPARFKLMFGPLLQGGKRHRELARAATRVTDLVKESLARGFSGDGRDLPQQVWLGPWALVHGLSVLAVDGHLGAESRNPHRLERLVLDVMQALNTPARHAPDAEGAPRSRRRLRTSRERSASAARR